MHAFRYLTPLAIVAALVVACSSDDVASSSSSSGSVPGTSSGGGTRRPGASSSTSSGWSGGTSGYVPDPLNPYGEDANSYRNNLSYLDVSSIASIKATKDTCGKPQWECLDAQSFTVDLGARKLTSTTCIELASSDDAGPGATKNVDSSHALTEDDIEELRTRLSGIGSYSYDRVTGFDGPQWLLEVTDKGGKTKLYAATSGCGPQDEMTKIAFGWSELWDSLSGM